MKTYLVLFISIFFSVVTNAQIDKPQVTNVGGLLKAEPEEEEATNVPVIREAEPLKEEREYLRKEPKTLDFRETNDDLLTAGSIIEKKWKKDREAKAAYKNDQYLGDFKTTGRFLEVYCRDHEYVDGDKVKVLLNGKVVAQSVSLGSGYRPILVSLESGYNTIEFVALNQGTSGPNTAELRVYGEDGKIITTNMWNLLTGAKASIVVVKQ